MFKQICLGILAVGAIGAAGFGVYAYKPAISPVTAADHASFPPEQVEQGRVLVGAGYCATCHTAKGGEPYAGNYAMETGFGTIYATNLTPDMETGIGAYSKDAFRRAMHEGVARDGSHLFPAFPYDHFTKMSDDDIDAIYAFIMSEVKPVRTTQKENELPFPLNVRFLQAGWKMLFVDFGEYETDPDKSAEWNRGAYLAEGVTHCGACHTPRNALGAEDADQKFAGAEIDRWQAPALTAANASAVPWNAAEFREYLVKGSTKYHGIAAGPMGPVVHAGVRELPDSDLTAISIYLADQVGADDSDPADSQIVQASLERNAPDRRYRQAEGERLYTTACAACHYNSQQINAGRPDLGINSSVNQNDPSNLIQVILYGVNSHQGTEGVVMPGFRDALSDDQITSIAAYLRADRAEQAPWEGLRGSVTELRARGPGTH
ncbi:cytochrome c [Paracoccus sp. JM45]|uniref:cytochrome c n=1 Tax=Paracoccus sp. JM45 TaxID=2283626 RepID=UPI000E6C2BED|nr:cytochrome c [Paracoccus sp. JM45]RJE79932.1 cytochrome c [Paracoccus sp. JM45]